MKRKALAGLGILTCVLLGLLILTHPFTKMPPNILLITIDTLRADHLSCYGYHRKITPTLDQLAAQGVLFENAFAVMPTTIPSHGSIFFGTWPRIHGSTGNQYKYSNNSLPFFPRLLHQAGYATSAFISRNHLAGAIKEIRGFQKLVAPRPYEERTCQTTLGLALKWLLETRPRRFFVWIHLWEPHQPYVLHPGFMKNIHPGFKLDFKQHYSFLPQGAFTRQELQKMVDLYDNEIAYVDHHLGLFLEKLSQEGFLDHTMLIVTSDHGETLDEIADTQRYAFDHGEFLYDPQLRVPLIIVPPGKRPRQRISQVVTLLDLMPTILQSAGLPVPDTVQGKTLSPTIEGQYADRTPQLVFLHRGKYNNPARRAFLLEEQFGVREKYFKLIYTAESHQWILYRNSQDGISVADGDGTKKALQERLVTWMKLTERLAAPTSQRVSPEEMEQLRSLGYFQ